MNNKEEFHEDYQNPHQDPLSPTTQEFDWSGLFETLGEAQDDMAERDYESLKIALRTICQWMLSTDQKRPGFESAVCRRVIALLWTVDPGYFEGSPSLAQLAKYLDVHRSTLSAYAASASRKFGIRNRGQVHGWNFKAELNRAQHAHNQAIADHCEGVEGETAPQKTNE